MGSSRSKATRTKRHPDTALRAEPEKPKQSIHQKRAQELAEAAASKRRGGTISWFDRHKPAQEFLAYCAELIRGGSLIGYTDMHKVLCESYGFTQTPKSVETWFVRHHGRIGDLYASQP